jgi:hypothetical protein
MATDPPVTRKPVAGKAVAKKVAATTRAGKGADLPEGEGGYVAVIHCHGMGSQRRLEETGRLIDSLDRYAYACEDKVAGILTDIQAIPEQRRGGGDPGETVSLIRSKFRQGPKGAYTFREVRFYEFYWAPIMNGQKSPWRILLWIVSQVLQPWRTLGSHWRERQRLRRAALAELFEPRGAPGTGLTPPKGAEPGDLNTLIQLYDKFEQPDMLRRYAKGSFSDFLELIGTENAGEPERVKRLTALAWRWFRHYLLGEVRNLVVLSSAVLALVLVAVGAVLIASLALQYLTALRIGNDALQSVVDAFKPKPGDILRTAIGAAGSFAVMIGLGRFLTDSMGDVEAWSTYRETDEKFEARRKVIAEGIATLTHVLSDDRCKRAVLLSHSLGTTIMNDTLLALGQRNKAANPNDPLAKPLPLYKIEHFVTMGSPIDKVEYFFESYSSKSHRYKRAVEDLRGDIGTPPFSKVGRQPHVHWINFWDEGDPVSGPLQSPTGSERPSARVDNVHVRNLHFPDPGKSHLAYLDNRKVVETLFGIIYRRDWSFEALTSVPGSGKAYDSVRLGPGEKQGADRFLQGTAIALPWLVLGGGVAIGIMGRQSLSAMLPALVATGVLILGYVVGTLLGQRNPN